MRLRLVVQRHSLPSVQLLWTIAPYGPIRSPYADAGASLTISQLLEQISEIIPLESEDWGLEDYAVEVGGFECLHFSEISHVLKEDDIVCVRPLQTTDIRFRKISGRHQISADGKHLFDGVAFGRPFLQLASRPPIRIPPRKKRRITYDEDKDDNVSNSDNQQLALKERPEDNDSQDDEESLSDEDDYQGLSDELEDIFNDNDAQVKTPEQMMDFDRLKNLPGRITRSNGNKGLGIHGATGLNLREGSSIAHRRERPSALLVRPVGEPKPCKKSKTKRGKGDREPGLRTRKQPTLQLYEETPKISGATVRSARLGEIDSTTPATIRDFEGSDRSSDEDFEPASNNMGDIDESDKENSQPREALPPRFSPSNRASSSSSQSSGTDQDSATSSSESPSADDSSDSEPEQLPSNPGHQSLPSDTSSLSGSGCSDPSSSIEKSLGETNIKAAGTLQKSRICAARNPKSLAAAKKSVTLSNKPISLPFQGKTQTKLRNQRRRLRRKVEKERRSLSQRLNGEKVDKVEVENSLESPAIGVTGMRAHSQRLSDTSFADLLSPNTSRKGPSAVSSEEAAANISATTIATMKNELLPGQSSESQDVGNSTSQNSTSVMAKKVKSVSTNAKTRQQRSKIDLESSRRMLFGSLGVRTPKTKEDETETREKLMKGFRPIKEPRFQGLAEANELLQVDGSEENGNWEDRIVLKAVECCYEGIELNTPPFPFVQRWDPQQQGGYKGYEGSRSRKTKKRKRNNSKFYEPVFSHEGRYGQVFEYDQARSVVEDPKEKDATISAEKQQLSIEDRGIDVHRVEANTKSTRESDASAKDSPVGTNGEDLPLLSEDMSTYVSLTVELSLLGAIIAFKQLDMSERTNWQPRVSEYRTATVDHLMDNGTLRMTLARRDRPQTQISYDQRTGERIYSKFEMPGLDEEEACEDGVIELSFAELIEPKLIRPASTESETTDQPDDQQCSMRGGNLTSENHAGIVEAVDPSPISPNLSNAKLPVVSTDINHTDSGREGIRKEIFSIIREAGWRSSIGSIIGGGKVLNDSIDNKNKEEHSLFLSSPDVSSPKISSPAAERAESGLEIQTLQPDTTIEKGDDSYYPISPSLNSFLSSSPIVPMLDAKSKKQDSETKKAGKDEWTYPNNPTLPSFISSLPGTPRTKGELEKQHSDRLVSVPVSPYYDVTDGFTEPKSFSDRPFNLENEDFGQRVDKNLGQNEPPLPSDVIEADHQIASQELASRGSLSEPPPPADLKNKSPPHAGSHSDSDSEFPSLEDVFSIFRSPHRAKHVGTSSFETEISEAPVSTQPIPRVKREEPAPFASQQLRKVRKEGSVPVSSLPERKPKPAAKNKFTVKQTLFAWPETEGDDQSMQALKEAKKQQVIDLTLSSDDSPDDDNFVSNATQLPTGPGWVQKTRASTGGNAAVKKGRRRLRKTTST